MNEKYRKIPQGILDGLHRYQTYGIMPGGFLSAVLENDLMSAVMLADEKSQEAFFEIVHYVYHELPYACHGSKEKIVSWIALKTEDNSK